MKLLLCMAVLLALAGCSDAGTPGSSRVEPVDIEYPKGAGDRVLTVLTTGGFVDVADNASDFPTFLLYGDGRFLTQRFVEYSQAPLVPAVEVRRVSEEGVRALLGAAREAGLFGGEAEFGHTGITDMNTTTITIESEGTHVQSIYGLGTTFRANPVDFEVRERRLRAQSFVDRLWDLEAWLPLGSVGGPEELEPASYLVFAEDTGAFAAEPGIVGPVPWPEGLALANLPAGATGVKCGVLSPQQAQQASATYSPENDHAWLHAGRSYMVYVRPLLPDESGCPSV